MKTRGQFILSVIFLLNSGIIVGQSPSHHVIPRLNGPVILDGRVDEPAWESVEPLPLVTHWPSFGNPVDPDETEIRIAHDENYLYVSCRCYGDPEKINAPTYKRDLINMSMDGVSIILDTFSDNENALWFNVSATGSRTDGAISNDAQSDPNLYWDTIWEAEALITGSGWTMEMRIPFSSLRFESHAGRVEMGLIAYRYMAHNVTMQIFPAIPTNWGFYSFVKPSRSQPVVFENVSSRNPVFVTPYLLGGMQRKASLNPGTGRYQHDTDLTYETGLDIKMGLTNNSTLDLTINTDFAQVEADDQQINLTRFSLFFPERRQFFLERAAIFDFSFGEDDRLFYSRRIGLHQGQMMRILGGARVIARSGGWDIGLLSMQTARGLGLSSENHSVLRLRKQLFNPRSYAGGMVTSRIDESGNYNIALGIDGIFNLWGDDFFTINTARTVSRGFYTSVFNHESIRLQTEWQRRAYTGLSYNFSYNYSGKLYNPGMGFQRRRNYMQFGERISWGWQMGESSPLQRIRTSIMGAVYLGNTHGDLETLEIGPAFDFTWKRGDYSNGEIFYVIEDIPATFHLSDDVFVPAGRYRFAESMFSYHTPRGRPLRAVFRMGGGGYYSGTRITSSIEPYWDPSRVVNLSLFYQYNRIEFSDRNQKLRAHVARFRTELTFNTRKTFSSFVQYNSANDIVVLNVRLRYNPKDGNNFYLVFNETLNANRDRSDPRVPLSDNRAIMLKFDYTF